MPQPRTHPLYLPALWNKFELFPQGHFHPVHRSHRALCRHFCPFVLADWWSADREVKGNLTADKSIRATGLIYILSQLSGLCKCTNIIHLN